MDIIDLISRSTKIYILYFVYVYLSVQLSICYLGFTIFLNYVLTCYASVQKYFSFSTPVQKHCILVCNSPPYQLPSQEGTRYVGFTSDQLASMMAQVFISVQGFYCYIDSLFVYCEKFLSENKC